MRERIMVVLKRERQRKGVVTFSGWLEHGQPMICINAPSTEAGVRRKGG